MPLIEESSDDRMTVYRLAGGDRLVVPKPPAVDETHHPLRVLAKITDAAGLLDEARRRYAADKTLTPVGKVEKLAGLRQHTETLIAEAIAEVEEFGRVAEQFTAKVYAPPALEPGDAAGAISDMEVRGYIRSASAKDRAELRQQIQTDPKLAAMVLRSPLPLGVDLHQIAERAWHDHIDSTDPKAKSAAGFMEAADWARSAAGQFAKFAHA
jgi:hypothetical protein